MRKDINRKRGHSLGKIQEAEDVVSAGGLGGGQSTGMNDVECRRVGLVTKGTSSGPAQSGSWVWEGSDELSKFLCQAH